MLGFGDGLIIERARASEFCPSAARRVHAFDSILDDMIALELRDCGEDVDRGGSGECQETERSEVGVTT